MNVFFNICGAHIWNKCVNTNHPFIFYRRVLRKNKHSLVLWRYLELLSVKVSSLQKGLNAQWCGPTYTYFKSVELTFDSYFAEFAVNVVCRAAILKIQNPVQIWTEQQANLDTASMRCSVCLLHSKTILFLSVNCLFCLIQKKLNCDSELSIMAWD